MNDLQNVAKKVGAEFEAMLDAGRIPVFEFECEKNGKREWYIVELSMHVDGIQFDIPDSDVTTWFSGNIVKLSDTGYLLPFDECFDNLDYYLSEINQEITEGYFMPNGFEILS